MTQIRSSFIIFISLALLGTMAILSCSDDVAATPSDPSVGIIPLKTGNSWTFLTTFYDTAGAVTFTEAVKDTITGDTIIAGTRWFYPSTTHDFMVTNLPDGYHWRALNSYLFRVNEMLLWKYPALQGDSFFSGTGDVTILSTSEIVTVPAGTFECYHYWSQYSSPGRDLVTGHLDAWLSPTAGVVKMEGYQVRANGAEYRNYKQELTAYTLK